jgi:class 3 adenylate cyclase
MECVCWLFRWSLGYISQLLSIGEAMGILSDKLKLKVKAIIHTEWEERTGQSVPEPENVPARNYAVKLDAAILYADLAHSTHLVDKYKWWFAGEVYKSYLECSAAIIKSSGASIVSYDGDRIMAVYVGSGKEDRAVNAALKINGAVTAIINPRIKEIFPNNPYEISQAIGIDIGEVYAAKVGVRNDNDLTWIGKVANRAAKLSDLRLVKNGIYVSAAVYAKLSEENKLSNGSSMWKTFTWSTFNVTAYHSAYRIQDF